MFLSINSTLNITPRRRINAGDAYQSSSHVGRLARSKALTFSNLQTGNQPTPPILAGSADLHFIDSLVHSHLSTTESAGSKGPDKPTSDCQTRSGHQFSDKTHVLADH